MRHRQPARETCGLVIFLVLIVGAQQVIAGSIGTSPPVAASSTNEEKPNLRSPAAADLPATHELPPGGTTIEDLLLQKGAITMMSGSRFARSRNIAWRTSHAALMPWKNGKARRNCCHYYGIRSISASTPCKCCMATWMRMCRKVKVRT